MADHVGVPPGAALDHLIAKWRAKADARLQNGGFRYHEVLVDALRSCADELEALRAALDAQPPQAPQKEQ